MNVNVDLLKTCSRNMRPLQLYILIKSKYSGKAHWPSVRDEIAMFFNISKSNLRGIKNRAIALGILKAGGKDWVFAVGNRQWIKSREYDVESKRKLFIPEEVWTDKDKLRIFLHSAFLSLVVREYGKADKKGQATMPLSLNYMEKVLGWGRTKCFKYRKAGQQAGHFKVIKDWEILCSTEWGTSAEGVKKFYKNLKAGLPYFEGEEYRKALTAKLLSDGKGNYEVLTPKSSIIRTKMRATRP